MKCKGTITALVTPMKSNGEINLKQFAELIEWQIASDIDGLVIAGSTGEAATLSHDDKLLLFKTAFDVTEGRTLLIAGTGTNCTQSSIDLTCEAYSLGYQFSLLVCPYYNKPTQKGLYLHYEAIAKACPQMQHILYSIPGRSVIQIEHETVINLAKINNIIGLKDSGSSIERIQQLRHDCPIDFAIVAGDDDFTFDCIKHGGNGVISVTSNVTPLAMKQLVNSTLQSDFEYAKGLHNKLMPLMDQLFCQTNPIPTKALLHHIGKIDNGIRLPLTWLEDVHLPDLLKAYEAFAA